MLFTTIYSLSFSAISNAFSVLSNSDKRQRYDQYGSEAERSHSHNRDDYSRGFEGQSRNIM